MPIWSARRGANGNGLAGDADEGDTVLVRQPEHDFEQARQDVQMLMAVGVDDSQAGSEQALDLPPQLFLDLRGGDSAAQVSPGEGSEIPQERAAPVHQRTALAPAARAGARRPG